MAIRSFAIGPSRGLVRAAASELPDLAVVAGPNGVGKSTLLHELWTRRTEFAEPGTEVTYVGPHRPWRKSTLSAAALFQFPYTFRELLGMPQMPGWEMFAPPGLQYIGGMARDPYSADEAQSLIKFSLAKIEMRRLRLLQSKFEVRSPLARFLTSTSHFVNSRPTYFLISSSCRST